MRLLFVVFFISFTICASPVKLFNVHWKNRPRFHCDASHFRKVGRHWLRLDSIHPIRTSGSPFHLWTLFDLLFFGRPFRLSELFHQIYNNSARQITKFWPFLSIFDWFQVHLGAIWWITMSMLNYAKLQSWVNSIEEPISPVIRPRHSSELLSRAFYLLLLRGFYDDGCFISRIGSRVKLSNCRWNWSRFLFNAIALNWIVELLTWSTNSSTMNQLDQNNGRSSFNSHSIELAVNFQTNLLYVSINSYRLLLFYQKFGNLTCFQFENELFSVINPTQRFRSD